MAAVLVLLAVLLVAFALGRASSSASAASTGAVTTVVQPGDTLWSLAVRTAPGRDPRVQVARIRSLNQLTGSALSAGQRLRLPG